MKIILETERLYLWEINQSDFDWLAKILKDEETMYAYEGVFNDLEVQDLLNKQIARYKKYNFGLRAIILKTNNELIGQYVLTI